MEQSIYIVRMLLKLTDYIGIMLMVKSQFGNSINLLDEGLSLKINGTNVTAYKEYPDYYVNER